MIDPYLHKNSETDAWGKGRSHTHKNIGKMMVLPMFRSRKKKWSLPQGIFAYFGGLHAAGCSLLIFGQLC
jgi:hypothetical protein